MESIMLKASENVNQYFKEHLPQYTVLGIERQSKHPEDSHIYLVTAKKSDGSYGFWSCWNEKLQTLNHGHYDIRSIEECERLADEYRNTSAYFTVYRCLQSVRVPVFHAGSEAEAEQFCVEHGWELKDENGFVWGLEHREA